MASVSKKEYIDVLIKAASDAAEDKVKQYSKLYKAPSVDDAESMRRKYFAEYKRRLENSYPYESVDKDKVNAIADYAAEKMRAWLDQYGAPYPTVEAPDKYREHLKAADIFPLLQGVAKEGTDWQSLSTDDLKQFGYAHNYNVKTKEGYAKLLKDIGEQQINYDRAKIEQEAKDSLGWGYWPSKVITPSAMQEFENAIMTGGDYDAGTAAKMGAVDALTNAAMWEAPGVFIGKEVAAPSLMPSAIKKILDKVPKSLTKTRGIDKIDNSIANGILGAIAQAGGEATRQGLEVGLSDNGQSVDVAPIVFAGSAGATRPAAITTLQGMMSRIPGESTAQFSRGFAKALKTGDPAVREAKQLEKSILNYNNNVLLHKDALEKQAQSIYELTKDMTGQRIAKYGQVHDPKRLEQADQLLKDAVQQAFDRAKKTNNVYFKVPLADAERAVSAGKLPYKAKFLGIDQEADGTYTASKLLEAYNKPLYARISIDPNGVANFSKPPLFATPASDDAKRIILDKKTQGIFRQMFPAKYADESEATGATKLGLGFGNLVGGFGSRVEPTFKLGSSGVGVDKTYKDENWYQALPLRSKKIIDEAFKKKEAEETEEE